MDQVKLSTPKQRALFGALKGCGDVPIDDLFAAIEGPCHLRSPRQKQRWLGSYLTRLNRRLAPHRLAVRPGDLKRTYRLHVV